jgi:integrase
MKSIYPEYKKRGLNKEKLYHKLSTNDKETFDKFIRTLSVGKNKLDDTKTSLLQFLDIIEKPIDKINLDDVREFNAVLGKSGRTPYTMNGTKAHIKRFLRHIFKDWSERFDNFKSLKQSSHAFNEEKINEGTLLTKKDIEIIISKEPDLMKKTFFICLYESGLRPKELRLLKWKNINFNIDGDITQFNIFATKTSKARAVYVKESTHYLKLLEQNNIGDYIFHSRESKDNPISEVTAFVWIRELGKYIDKKIFPYLLRHSRATELYKSMPSKIAQKFMGHGADMSDIYSHMSSQDVKDAMVKSVYKFKDLKPEEENELKRQIEAQNKRIAELEANQNKNNEAVLKLLNKFEGKRIKLI